MRKKKSVAARVEKLLLVIKDRRNSLIVLQDNPDPDAIGSAVGLKQLYTRFGDIRSTIAHGGTVGRAENRALVEFLGVKLVPMSDIDPATFDLISMVDTQPATGNNSLDLQTGRLPDVVIDHHPRRPELRRVPFVHVDIRYGATSTMITEYLYDRDIKPNKKTATALVYGIKTDTAALTREARRADKEAMQYLYPLHLPEVLARIENEKVPRKYFKDFKTAMEAATIYGNVVFANLSKVQNPDMVGEIADFLLRLEEMQVVLVVGVFEDELILSCRVDEEAAAVARDLTVKNGKASGGEPDGGAAGGTKSAGSGRPEGVPEEARAGGGQATPAEPTIPDPAQAAASLDAGAIMKIVVGEDGAGGGHATMAGGRVPLGKRATRKDAGDVARACESRFIGIFGMKRKEKKDLT